MTQKNQISVTLTPKLRLKHALKKAGVENSATVTRLTVTGRITKDDFRYIRENMAKTLQELDMGKATVKRKLFPDLALRDCIGLTSVTIPDSVTNIGGDKPFIAQLGAFYGCRGLKSVIIPDSVKYIGFYTFFSCPLTSIQIPNLKGLSYLESCHVLTNITVHPDNPVYASENGVLFNKEKTKLIFCPRGREKKYVIPASVKEIEDGAFSRIAYCYKLLSVVIPDSVVSIRNDEFNLCSKLRSVTVHAKNAVYASHNGVLYNKEKTRLIFCPRVKKGEYVIPDSVKIIGKDAFKDCKKLTLITIPNSVEIIEEGAFYGCTSLMSVTIPDSVIEIGDAAFVDIGFTSIVIPDSVIKIGESAFAGCTGLTSIAIPDSVIKIGESTFYECAGLTSITISDSVTEIGDNAFCGTSLTSITIPKSVTKISNYFSHGCVNLTSITVHPDNPVYSSQNGVLFNKDMTELILYPYNRKGEYIIPDSVTKIASESFEHCSELSHVTIPNSMIVIEGYAFSDCSGLTEVIIPDSIVNMGYLVFEGCNSLTALTVHPNNPAYSSENGILFNKDKTELVMCPVGFQGDYVIPDSVKIIRSVAFHGCKGLTSITIPDSVVKIGLEAFYRCEGLMSVILPDSVTEIYDGAFSGCSNLISINIPDSVTEIKAGVFFECYKLTNITKSTAKIKFEAGAYYECPALENLLMQFASGTKT